MNRYIQSIGKQLAEAGPSILLDLRNMLEVWEKTEYPSDEARWQSYASDLEKLIDYYESGESEGYHGNKEKKKKKKKK